LEFRAHHRTSRALQCLFKQDIQPSSPDEEIIIIIKTILGESDRWERTVVRGMSMEDWRIGTKSETIRANTYLPMIITRIYNEIYSFKALFLVQLSVLRLHQCQCDEDEETDLKKV
jgi:hypothetical protein